MAFSRKKMNHTIERAFERYGLKIDQRIYSQMNKLIREKSEFVIFHGRLSQRSELVTINMKNNRFVINRVESVLCIFLRHRKQISTVLPIQSIEAKLKRIKEFEKSQREKVIRKKRRRNSRKANQ